MLVLEKKSYLYIYICTYIDNIYIYMYIYIYILVCIFMVFGAPNSHRLQYGVLSSWIGIHKVD